MAAARGTIMARKDTDDIDVGLATLPPTSRQTWSAIAVTAILLAGVAAVAPFADTPLVRIDSFIPMVDATIFVTDLITSILLFSQFSIYHSRALLALASGYLFTALMIVPHALTFPGAFSPTGLLGGGLQTTAWLYWFWHLAFPLVLLAYGWLKDEERAEYIVQRSTLVAVGLSAMLVLALVCGLTWLATAGDKYLPRLLVDRTHTTSLNTSLGAPVVLICATAIAVLWTGRRSVLDQWLMVVAVAAILEIVLTVMLVTARFSLGFYVSRGAALITSTVVLVVLLAETARLYARLAHSNIMLRRAQNNKLMNLEAMAASIAHEMRQPLAALAMNGTTALLYLDRTPPDVEEVRSSLNDILSDGQRASQIFDNLLHLFGKSDARRELINVNEVAVEALRVLHEQLDAHVVLTRTELTSEMLQVMGHRGQLIEVIINLVQNAIEAMDAVEKDRRVLQLRTECRADAIIVAVEDSGPGIDPEKSDNIFDAFVTTKSNGTGLGLAICRMIVERHEGKLSVSPAQPHGCIFQIVLPRMNLPH